ncbi:MAG: hypothetical protein A2687_03250 [Candidatus Levybacteria bacterium RIFCSPHIGHO2_01_FULL_38_26]|nr:MAG: hypothetical protein A2687_03250 [Candidatus Levybacteria bacterium RIFCSPHIGHO2_01_FULL_38_26]
MNENEFIKTLEARAREQGKIIINMPMPKVFRTVCFWLGDHPLRILVPLAFIINFVFHSIIGQRYDEFILKIFGKL